LAELLYNAYGVIPQSDRWLYYPELPVLKRLAAGPPGRFCGARATDAAPPFCLPANLGRVYDLVDLRGYDGADPASLVTMLELANPRWAKAPHFAVTQSFQPDDSALLDLLNLRYRVYHGTAPAGAGAWIEEDDYWVEQRASALPRPFVPKAVEVVADPKATLDRLARDDFDPRAVAFVDVPVDLPETEHRGTARIENETPTRLTINLDMETPGLVVLADLWYAGWHATLNGQPTTILRANGFLRGVVVPAGQGTLEFHYAPATFLWGLAILAAGMSVLLIWQGTALVVCRPWHGWIERA
jgi:hypothetical protein